MIKKKIYMKAHAKIRLQLDNDGHASKILVTIYVLIQKMCTIFINRLSKGEGYAAQLNISF